MVETRILLSGLWVALMLTYLLGDALRIFLRRLYSGGYNGYAGISGNMVRSRNTDVDSDCYGCTNPDIAVSRDSLGKRRCSHDPFCF